ncbi:MAG: O-antigen ligase family protein [Acidobacteriota bacterium]
MTCSRAAFASKFLFLAVNAMLSGLLCWEMSGRAKLFVLAVPLACALCLRRREAIAHLMAALGAGLMFFGFQSYSAQAQVLHYLVSVCALMLLAAAGAQPRRQSYGPLRLWFMGFVGLMLAGLPLLPLGEFAQALRELGPLGFARMAGYSVASSSFYALAALGRLALYALFAWELSRFSDDDNRPDAASALLRGVAASLPAALVFGLAEYFLARGKAYAMSDRLTSLFLNPGWFAEYVCVGLPFLLLFGRRRGRWFFFAMLGLSLAAMVFTMARAAWLLSALLAVSCVVASLSRFDLLALDYRRMAKGAVLGAAAVAMLGLGVYGALSATRISLLNFPLATMITQRLERFSETPRPTVFKSGMLVGRESPVSGMGYETYAWHYPALMAVPSSGLARGIPADAEVFEATHNLFIQIFAGGGALALAAWLLLAGRCAQLALRRHRRRADAMSLGVLLSLAAFHVFGLFQEMIYIPAVWLLFFAVAAWCLRQEDEIGGWIADFTQDRAARATALAVLAALLINLDNAGYAATARRLGIGSYPPEGVRQLQGFSGPEAVDGRLAMWSCGASSLRLVGPGPWRFEVGLPHPDLSAKPVRVALSRHGRVLAEASFGPGTARTGALTVGADRARPGDLVHLSVSRLYYPIVSGIKDHRALGAWVAGPGLGPVDGHPAGAGAD